MIISFFHIGSDTSQAEMLCRSAKSAFKGSNLHLIQLSNYETPKTKSADSIIRLKGVSLQNIMLSRMRAYKECLKRVSSPVAFFDTDILILKKFELDTSSMPLLCRREYNLDHIVNKKILVNGKFKDLFDDYGGKKIGETYPFLGCFFADKDTLFLENALNIFEKLEKKYHQWFGDQISLREAAVNIKSGSIGESIIAGDPLSKAGNNEGTIALHFKGNKKNLMESFFHKLLENEVKSYSYSFRSNPNKLGYEIPDNLNPYFKDYLAGSSSAKQFTINPESLDIGARADIICKLMYLLSCKMNLLPEWVGTRVYTKSISALNGGKGLDSPHKRSIKDYLSTYEDLYEDLSKKNDSWQHNSVIPISSDLIPIDGAHRISISILLGINLPTLKIPVKRVAKIPITDLTDRFGLTSYEEFLALRTYARFKKNSSIFILFPSRDPNKDKKVLSLLENYFRIDKNIQIRIDNSRKSKDLVRALYADCDWLGNANNNFQGLEWKSRQIAGKKNLADILFCTPHDNSFDSKLMLQKDVKELCRSIYGIGFHSMHCTDTVDEKLLLIDNFLLDSHLPPECRRKHSLNFSFKANLQTLKKNQIYFLDSLIKLPIEHRERIIISGGMVMALLGIRETTDIDVIGDIKLPSGIQSHNAFASNYGDCKSYEDFIRDPSKTMWLIYRGKAIRTITLYELYKIKLNRFRSKKTQKDKLDAKLIQNQLSLTLEVLSS